MQTLYSFKVEGIETLIPELCNNLDKENPLIVSSISRIGNNHYILIDLLQEILIKIPNVILYFVVEESLQNNLIEKVKINNIEKNIIFLGSMSDIAVFQSSFEEFRLVMLKKLLIKSPEVASNLEPFQGMVTHNGNWYLILLEKKDEWIKTIINLHKDKIVKKEIGEKGYKSALKFSIENTVRLYAQYYYEYLLREK